MVENSPNTYAEQYVEPFIRSKFGLNEPDSDDHDAVGADGTKYEIKASKILRPTGNGKGKKRLLDRILFENNNIATNRLIPFREHETAEYLANIQNVKRDHFDVLIYVLLFGDLVYVFFLDSKKIVKQFPPGWSDKHGRYDAPGKSGQFGITKSNISWHLAHTLKQSFTYKELLDTYEQI